MDARSRTTIVATPKTAGIWLVRDGNSKRVRQTDEAAIFDMPDIEEKIAACEKTHKKQHYTFTIDPPPNDWSIAVDDIVYVDIGGVGFVSAPVTKVFLDGWFEVKLKTAQYKTSWRDQLSYLEEGQEWVRATSPQAYRKSVVNDAPAVKSETPVDADAPAIKSAKVDLPETSFSGTISFLKPVLPKLNGMPAAVCWTGA
jgi:hypothetical protein